MKPTVLVAAGCSWVAGRAIDTDPTSTNYDYSHVEDSAFVREHCFAGLVQKSLAYDELALLAKNGTNNEEQIHCILDFVLTNKDNYSKIFVLFATTSIYRWQMFSSVANEVIPCAIGLSREKQPELNEEFKYYSKHFFNKDLELSRLSDSMIMLDGYLTNLNIDHLFVNSFQSYNIDIDDSHYYQVQETNNDLVNLLCKSGNIVVPKSSVPFMNFFGKTQYITKEISELQKAGLLDVATAHPTVEAHKIIADELYSYIKDKRNVSIQY